MRRLVWLGLLSGALAWAQLPQYRALFNNRDLSGWLVRGESVWTVVDGNILGQRRHFDLDNPFGSWPADLKLYRSWLYQQAWLYTVQEFEEFDLHVEYWLPPGGNSGISIRDLSRAHYAIAPRIAAGDPPMPTELKGTPGNIGYEIQIVDGEKEKYPTGSIYGLVAAPGGRQKKQAWNSIDIESRLGGIKVRLNGKVVATHPGLTGRPLQGPIGLQLHDQFSMMMFRNIRIREIPRRAR